MTNRGYMERATLACSQAFDYLLQDETKLRELLLKVGAQEHEVVMTLYD